MNPLIPSRAILLGLCATLLSAPLALADRTEVDLSDRNWRLWHDTQAKWETDDLFLPPVNLAALPVNAPTGGWQKLSATTGVAAAVPGTAEEYLSNGMGASGDIKGVTWWYRTLQIPRDQSPRKLLLRVESARHRCEVYVNGQLAGYDVVGNTPFEVDLSPFAKPGQSCQLALRVTDPGGNFDWYDYWTFKWGKYSLPLSHGFGGITGRVKLISAEEVYVDDLYVQNLPAVHDVNALVTVQNTTAASVTRDLTLHVTEKSNPTKEVFTKTLPATTLQPGTSRIEVPISVPDAKLWDTDNPNLYTLKIALNDGNRIADSDQKTFGFRWFAPEGIGQDATFRLNGKRVVVRTAISWGFWPTNGMYATPEMAEKQIRAAKSLGLNMLNFHRCIGSPVVFEKADELGLLYFEEPGGYVAGGKDPFAQGICREKLLRMVRRDRSHPSLVIYNMINEQWTEGGADRDEALFEIHKADQRAAHALDPSRTLTYASSWAYEAEKEQRVKLHMRPFDDKQYFSGWQDVHRACGPVTWLQGDYQSPTQHIGYTSNAKEIVYWGEEGAISAPPRLEKIKADLAKSKQLGWDGAIYLQWYAAFDQFLDRKQLRKAFPTVDALTCAMGEVSLEHQGRRTECLRINNLNDGYATNGWEAEISENHSGIVDCFRNPKADPAIMAYYNQPLYVAIKARQMILQSPGEVTVDLFIVNEKNLTGPHTLHVTATNAQGKPVFTRDLPVSIVGGDTYGQLLAEAVKIPFTSGPGTLKIEAALLDAAGNTAATGRERLVVVDWKSDVITGNGAIYEHEPRVTNFLKNAKGITVPAYRDELPKLDWIVVARPLAEALEVIPGSALRDLTGQSNGLTATFYSGIDFGQKLTQRIDEKVDFDLAPGAPPDAHVAATENYSVRWEGSLIPPATGSYTIAVGGDDGFRLWLDDKLVAESWKTQPFTEIRHTLNLVAGKSVKIRLDYFQAGGGARCRLAWLPPATHAVDPNRLLARAQNDGTTIIILDHADIWMDLIQKHSTVRSNGTFKVGTNWLGGQFFVRQHPLFDGLPVNGALNWPYQRLVVDGPTRYAFELEGEQLVAGAYQSWPFQLGTAVAVIPAGKGHLVVSSLAIADSLNDPDNTADVGRKLLCNFIKFAATPTPK